MVLVKGKSIIPHIAVVIVNFIFHGSIKRKKQGTFMSDIRNFNSNVVRLKVKLQFLNLKKEDEISIPMWFD